MHSASHNDIITDENRTEWDLHWLRTKHWWTCSK